MLVGVGSAVRSSGEEGRRSENSASVDWERESLVCEKQWTVTAYPKSSTESFKERGTRPIGDLGPSVTERRPSWGAGGAG